MAAALELDRSLWEVQEDDDEEITFMVRKMKYEELPGKRKGTFFHTPNDDHIYRRNKNAKDNKKFVACYHVKLTNDRDVNIVEEKCSGYGVLDPETREIKITNAHNHEPDLTLLKKLQIRNKILTEVANTTTPLNQVFHDATRGVEGAELVGWPTISSTMQRQRRENFPPPPLNAEEAHEFLTSVRYSSQNFAKYYQGLVRGSQDNETALTFAHEGNLSKLGPETKVLWGDGTFRTAPALRDNKHEYQILRVYGEYKSYTFPIFQAIMNKKSKSLYDSVYSKLTSVPRW